MGWKKAEVHEALATLYLRLNGYFTTGLILHTPEWGQNRTEADCVAIRHSHHSEPERGVDTAEFLATQKGETDIIICEVKTLAEALTFNQPLREDPEALRALLRWVGVFDPEQVPVVADQLKPLLASGTEASLARIGITAGRYRVRGLLCCPPASEAAAKSQWCLVGSEILRFADKCFNPTERRDACSTRYNFRQWGYALAPLVQYFKNVPGGATPTLEGLYRALDAA